jgi:hypothetical protein
MEIITFTKPKKTNEKATYSLYRPIIFQ